MDTTTLFCVISSILVTANGLPINSQNKDVITGVFIPADTFENLKSDADNQNSDPTQIQRNLAANLEPSTQTTNNVNRQVVSQPNNPQEERTNQPYILSSNFNQPKDSMPVVVVDSQQQPQQVVIDEQTGSQKIIVYPQNQNQQLTVNQLYQNQPAVLKQEPQPLAIQPNQVQPIAVNQPYVSQPVFVNRQPPSNIQQNQPQSMLRDQYGQPIFVNQPVQPMVLVQTQQPGQQQLYTNKQPNTIIFAQEPNQGQIMTVQQRNQQNHLVPQTNQPTLYVNQPSNQQQVQNNQIRPSAVTAQPNQQTIWLTPSQLQSIRVGQPNLSQNSVNVLDQPYVTINENQPQVFKLIPLYNQNSEGNNGQNVFVPVRQKRAQAGL